VKIKKSELPNFVVFGEVRSFFAIYLHKKRDFWEDRLVN